MNFGYGDYYYWEDSRYIGYRPDTNDQTINEILPYSNVIGDMHAHHIDTMFVFTTLGLLVDLIISKKDEKAEDKYITLKTIILGTILGIHKMTNFWDFPIYLVVMFLVIIFNNLTKYHFNKETVLNTFISLAEILLIQTIVTLPFTNDLYMSASEVLLTHVRSPFYKMCVFWALPTVLIIVFIVILINRFLKEKEKKKFWKPLFNYISNVNKADLFIFIIGCCAIGLMLIPEFIYVKDIYDDVNKRANTVYKVCYQAEILFDISASYILIRLICFGKKWYNKILPIIFLIMFISTFGYGMNAIAYTSNNFNKDNFVRLDSTEDFLKNELPAEYEAVQWIKENISKDDVIVQRTDGSYNIFPYVSVLTGNPTVLGWHGHEWIWRAPKDYSCPKEVSTRWDDVWYIYNSQSKNTVRGIINKYNISYIYISDNGQEGAWQTANRDLLLSMGKVVYNNGDVYIVDVR